MKTKILFFLLFTLILLGGSMAYAAVPTAATNEVGEITFSFPTNVVFARIEDFPLSTRVEHLWHRAKLEMTTDLPVWRKYWLLPVGVGTLLLYILGRLVIHHPHHPRQKFR